jgi:hypothetical protein
MVRTLDANLSLARTASPRRRVGEINMRDFLGGISIMVGLGFFGWGLLFLFRFPNHGQGKAALVLGLSAVLIGIILIFPGSRSSD